MNLSSRPSRTWYLDENIKKHKLIKVRITNKVTNYIVGSKTYLPGDVVGVPEEYINESFMERVDKPKEPEVAIEQEEEPKATLVVAPDLVAEQEPRVKPDVKRITESEKRVRRTERRAKKK